MIAAAAAGLLLAAKAASFDVVNSPPPLPPPHRLWGSPGGSVWVIPCSRRVDPWNDCVSLQVRRGREFRTLGTHYLPVDVATGVLWRRRSGLAGPDVLVFGGFGGSDGCQELFAVTFTASAVRSQKLDACHDPPLPIVVRRGRAATELVFVARDVAENGADAFTAGVRVPAIWTGRGFSVDLVELAARSRGPDDLAVREAAVDASLEAARNVKTGEVYGDALRPAVQSLFGLMLYGRASEARALLHASWPVKLVSVTPYVVRSVPGEAAFWRRLCTAAVRNPLWAEIGMDRISHADLIHTGARPETVASAQRAPTPTPKADESRP